MNDFVFPEKAEILEILLMQKFFIFWCLFVTKTVFFFDFFICGTKKKLSKIDFFRFFQKCSKSCLNIIYRLETGFKHFEGDFYAIFDKLYIIWTNLEKIDFFKKMHFLRFFAKIQLSENYRFGYKKASKIEIKTEKYGP